MKILLVHKFFHYNGGADVFFFEVGRVLREHGHEVAFFSTKSEKNLPTEWASYFVEAPDFKSPDPLKRLGAFASIPYSRSSKKAFARLLDDFRPDLIHCFNIMTQISPSILDPAEERGIPVVMSLNDYKHICPCYKLYHDGKVCEDCRGGKYINCLKNRCAHGSLAYSFASTWESYVHTWRKVYEKVTLFTCASDFMVEKTESFWGKKIHWRKLLNPFKITAPLDPQDGEFGLYFGRLIDEKGVDILLRALDKAREVPFVIVGNGPEEQALLEFKRERGLDNVVFAGPKWEDELREYLQKARFIVVPSIWHENFPYVILQAFAAGKPVLGTRRGGIPELVTEDRGCLYEASDVDGLASSLVRLWNDPGMCRKMGAAGRKYIEMEFSDEKFYESVRDSYNKAFELKGLAGSLSQ